MSSDSDFYSVVLLPVHSIPIQILRRAVESILNQQVPSSLHFILLILQDGPLPTPLSEYLFQIQKQFPHVKSIALKEKKGISTLLNVGISLCLPPLTFCDNDSLQSLLSLRSLLCFPPSPPIYIFRMDSDDFSFPHRFAQQIHFMENIKNSHIDIMGTPVEIKWENKNKDKEKDKHSKEELHDEKKNNNNHNNNTNGNDDHEDNINTNINTNTTTFTIPLVNSTVNADSSPSSSPSPSRVISFPLRSLPIHWSMYFYCSLAHPTVIFRMKSIEKFIRNKKISLLESQWKTQLEHVEILVERDGEGENPNYYDNSDMDQQRNNSTNQNHHYDHHDPTVGVSAHSLSHPHIHTPRGIPHSFSFSFSVFSFYNPDGLVFPHCEDFHLWHSLMREKWNFANLKSPLLTHYKYHQENDNDRDKENQKRKDKDKDNQLHQDETKDYYPSSLSSSPHVNVSSLHYSTQYSNSTLIIQKALEHLVSHRVELSDVEGLLKPFDIGKERERERKDDAETEAEDHEGPKKLQKIFLLLREMELQFIGKHVETEENSPEDFLLVRQDVTSRIGEMFSVALKREGEEEERKRRKKEKDSQNTRSNTNTNIDMDMSTITTTNTSILQPMLTFSAVRQLILSVWIQRDPKGFFTLMQMKGK